MCPYRIVLPFETQEAVLTAVEALLVSLYGYRADGDPPAEKQAGLETPPSPPGSVRADASPPDQSAERHAGLAGRRGNLPNSGGDAAPSAGISADASLRRRTSDGSSSSSVAEDWVVNQIPAGVECSAFFHADETAQSARAATVGLVERHEDKAAAASGAASSEGRISAADWSRGTALIDPATREPLRPVEIHQAPRNGAPDCEVEGRSSSNRKMLNAITEKRASLTAYDLISNRATRAPLTPVALFEKEARAEVLREKPTASLLDVSGAVHERWKNLREEDRKK